MALPLLYVVGYFWACIYVPYTDYCGLHAIDRIYPRYWQMVVFEPASKVETYVRRIDVYVSVGHRAEIDDPDQV